MRRFSVLLVSLLASASAEAQVYYGSIVGTVEDQSGGIVPSAAVTITNVATSQSRETATDPVGRYSIVNVLPGRYELRVSAAGFKTFSRSGLEVTINTVTRADVKLEVGAITEQVTVEASAAVLQTDKADVHVELSSREITTLTLPNYRNYQSLINLVPGATPAGFQNAVIDTPGRALTTNINGTNRNNNTTRLDGAANINLWLPHHVHYVPPAETIETVNITTNSFDAEQGMAGGAATTVITKSGTNDLHGVAFWYHDNQQLRARHFFSREPGKPKNIINIPGATLGGPIVKNKLFFFGGWEGMRQRVNRSGLYTVPTEPQRRGDFSGFASLIYDPATGDSSGRGRQAFANNIVPLARQSAATRKMVDLTPLPNQPGVTANYYASDTQAFSRGNYDIKINWNRNDRHSIWGKYGAMAAEVVCRQSLGAAGGPGLCDGGHGIGDTLDQVATVGHSWVITPTFLIDGTLGWTRRGQEVRGADFGRHFGLETLGIPGTNGPDIRQSGMPAFAVTGYTTLGNGDAWIPLTRGDQSWTFTTNLNRIHGGHDMRFGFEAVHHHLNHWSPHWDFGPQGRFSFDGGGTALNGGASPGQYNAYAQFLLGLPATMGKTVQFLKLTALEWQFGGYFRDRWQVTQKLTLTLGMRYEYYPLMTRAHGGIERYEGNSNLLYLGGLGGQPKNVGVTTSKRLFAPRLGFAYRATASTVIRTGYGITYNPMALARPLQGFYPLMIVAGFPAPNAFQPVSSVDRGIPEVCCPDISQGVLSVPGPTLVRTPGEGLLKRGYIQSWNFVIERKLPAELLVSAGYIGTQTIRSFADLDVNAAQQPGTGQAGRPHFARHGRTAQTLLFQGYLSANYHSLQLALNRPFRGGLFLKGAYTFSKAINFTDEDGWASVGWHAPSVFSRNRAPAGYHIPQILQLGFSYALPLGRGKRLAPDGVGAAVLGGWQVNGVFSSYQGRPFTVSASGASLNMPGNSQTADQVKPIVERLGAIFDTPFYDPAAFRPVTEVRFGTSGRNILRGPGVVNLDMSLFREFRLAERWRLELRTEAFNLTNTPHFSNPAANASVPASFMRITSATRDERQFRFGVRLSF
jgi:hypothetical protein